MHRPAEALALVAEGRKTETASARSFEIDGLLAAAQNKPDDAKLAFTKAVDLGSDNFYVYFWLAARTLEERLAPPALADVETQLKRVIELNPDFAPALDLLGNVMVRQNRLVDALASARRAALLEPTEFSHRLVIAQILSRSSRPDEAGKAAQDALAFAHTEAQRQAVHQVVNSIATAAAAASSSPSRSTAAAPVSAPTAGTPPPAQPNEPTKRSIEAPRVKKRVEPVYPEQAPGAADQRHRDDRGDDCP
jgi:tetratricopeptide (TPR) repeat protein